MIHVWNFTAPLRRQAAVLSGVVAVLVFVSASSAADLDFNVTSGNFTTAGNWIDTTNVVPVPAASAPTAADRALIRNNGTVTINSDVEALQIRVGYHRI